MADHADNTRSPYSSAALWFHWITVAFVLVLVPVGIIMADRGARNIWDEVTNNLYSTHKLLGFILLWIVVLRLITRLWLGGPPLDPTLPRWQATIAMANHLSLYALLIVLPLLGWLGVSMFPALEIFGLFSLPSLAEKSDISATVLTVHKTLALVLVALIALHVSAALFHYFIRRDNVLQRMLPFLRKR